MTHRKPIAGVSIYMIVVLPDGPWLYKPEPIILLALPIIPFRISQKILFTVLNLFPCHHL